MLNLLLGCYSTRNKQTKATTVDILFVKMAVSHTDHRRSKGQVFVVVGC